jgi:hypothetical protein
MTTEKQSKPPKQKIPSRGGKREGSGRPKGSTHKLTAKDILAEAENMLGKPFVISLLEGYALTVLDDDRKNRVVYEKMLLDKVASQLVDIEVDETSTVENRQHAFLKALETIGTVAHSVEQDPDADNQG